MSKIVDWLARGGRPWIFAVALLLVVGVGVPDYHTGPQIGFPIFYLVPVWLVIWHSTRSGGFLIAGVPKPLPAWPGTGLHIIENRTRTIGALSGFTSGLKAAPRLLGPSWEKSRSRFARRRFRLHD